MKNICLPRLLLLVVVAVMFLFHLAARADEPAPVPDELDVHTARQLMQQGRLTAVQLTAHYLNRIEALNDKLNAIITINPDALAQARALDDERRAGKMRGPLHGIPVILKDNIESRDKMPTTAGSLALRNNYTQRDATLTANLRAAGAVILAKANLSEWANFRSTRSSSGWSAIGGQTRNPYDLNKSPCGSSSGSAVAVAADLAPLAVGTETDGSVTCPASITGTVGIKPTVGLVSRTGIVPISHRQDTAGPLARMVRDAAVLLTAMAGHDPDDPATGKAGQHDVFGVDFAARLDQATLEGKRIGVLRGSAGFHEAVDALFDQAVADLKAAGAVIVDDLEFPETEQDNGPFEHYFDTLRYDFKRDLNRYLAGLPDVPEHARDLAALIAFNQAHAGREMPWFGQEIFEQSQNLEDFDEQAYTSTVAQLNQIARGGIDGLLDEHRLDALVAPTRGAAWSIDKINGDAGSGGSSTYAAISGYPHITVPMGFVHHLPVGLSFMGTAVSDRELIALAHAYEQASNRRRPPPAEPTMIMP